HCSSVAFLGPRASTQSSSPVMTVRAPGLPPSPSISRYSAIPSAVLSWANALVDASEQPSTIKEALCAVLFICHLRLTRHPAWVAGAARVNSTALFSTNLDGIGAAFAFVVIPGDFDFVTFFCALELERQIGVA